MLPMPPVVPVLSDRDIVLITMKKQHGTDAYLLRLLNNSTDEKDCALTVGDASIALHFGRYEVKTVRFDGGLTACERLEV